MVHGRLVVGLVDGWFSSKWFVHGWFRLVRITTNNDEWWLSWLPGNTTPNFMGYTYFLLFSCTGLSVFDSSIMKLCLLPLLSRWMTIHFQCTTIDIDHSSYFLVNRESKFMHLGVQNLLVMNSMSIYGGRPKHLKHFARYVPSEAGVLAPYVLGC